MVRLIALLLACGPLVAGSRPSAPALPDPGDTLWVQTFTFDSIATRRALFPFPEGDQDWRRILMYYTIKCDERTPGDPYPCGEWDVNTYVRLWQHTGEEDSTRREQPLFTVRGQAPDSLRLCRRPVYDTVRRWSATRPAGGPDHYLAFDEGDYLVVPPAALENCVRQLTIAFWLRGSEKMPRNNNLLEACRATGRALNIHLPWGTGEVYWDAGGYLSGANNRLQKQAQPWDYKGGWNHWAFSRNLDTGTLSIHLNGQLWHSADNMQKPLEPVDQFVIGGNCNGDGGWFSGGLDDFRIYSRELGPKDLAALMAGKALPGGETGLELCYDFNDRAPRQWIRDLGPRGLDARRVGQPRSLPWGAGGAIDLKPAPGAVVIQDSLACDPLAILIYDNPDTPTQPADTLLAWPAERVHRDANGNLLAREDLPADTVLAQRIHVWYDNHRERVLPLEVERYITPYGKGLDLGQDGFTHIRDVSAYAPYLKGLVDLEAHNGYELLDLRFAFLPGPPPRPVLSVEPIWPEEDYGYADLAADRSLPLALKPLRPDTKAAAVRSRISGHGHYGPRNCCEWDAKRHFLAVNGIPRFDWTIWTNCGDNPIHPQGGTWQFDRAGWCPGTFVLTRDHEITPWITGDSLCALDYSIEAPDPATGEGDGRYYQSHQLIQYGPLRAPCDLCLEEILAPSDHDEFRRLNPISQSPRVRVRNLGASGLRTFRIRYGLEGRMESVFDWQGPLGQGEAVELVLPAPDWSGMAAGSRFRATVDALDGQDAWPADNSLASRCPAPLVLPATFVIQFDCPPFGRAADNRWIVLDAEGRITAERSVFPEDGQTRDTLSLAPGPWELHLLDDQQDGLIRHWWLRGSDPDHVGTNGRLLLLSLEGDTLKNLGTDFAEGVSARFFVRE